MRNVPRAYEVRWQTRKGWPMFPELVDPPDCVVFASSRSAAILHARVASQRDHDFDPGRKGAHVWRRPELDRYYRPGYEKNTYATWWRGVSE